MNRHQLIDERSFELHQVVARILRESPESLTRVRTWITQKLHDTSYSQSGKEALREWLQVIDVQGVSGVVRVLDNRGEEATRLRQRTPFALLMPLDEREAIFKKYESPRTRTSFAGV